MTGSRPMNKASVPAAISLPKMVGYGIGECANSLITNGFFAFAMLYYTQVLELSPSLAGIAMGVSVFWEAMTEPVIGHLSDQTRSRFGRRHPWILAGGLIMALCFYFSWDVPTSLMGQPLPTFWYLVGINLCLRTGLTMFFIPYVALGFELCTDYDGASKLQAIRQILNMVANFIGPALAWSLFYKDAIGPNGDQTLGTTVRQNFIHMGTVFSLATLILVLLVFWLTRYSIQDTRANSLAHSLVRRESFWPDMRQILGDPNPRWIFGFVFFFCVGMMMLSTLQMYIYIYFMKFSPHAKSIVHGLTMVGVAIGAALSPWLAKRYDKKRAVVLGGVLSIACNGLLAVLFLTGISPVDTLYAQVLFALLHGTYWLGNGIMLPLATAMMADVAELHRSTTGVNKDGGYSAIFNLVMRLSISFSFIITGWLLSCIGVMSAEHTNPSTEAIWRLGVLTFAATPLFTGAALLLIKRYPLSRSIINQLKLKQVTD